MSMQETLLKLQKTLDSVKDPMSDEWDPIELGLLFAKLEYVDLDVAKEWRDFLPLFDTVARSFPKDANFRDQTQKVLDTFTQELGFSGDKSNYYNIKNSFINDVLLRRKGIPISLSLVFMGLCKHVGLRAVGISFPGHFLVRMVPSRDYLTSSRTRDLAEDWRNQWYVDCFDGKILSVQECEQRLQEWTRGALPFGPDVLKVAHPREILSRQLRNLRAILMEKEDLPRLYWIITALIELVPSESTEAYRERGLLMARMERYRSACEDFRKYLSLSPDFAKRTHVERLMELFESRAEVCN